MKIGILTFHRAENFGAVLQAYALQTFLKKAGVKSYIIDYRCIKVEIVYHVFNPMILFMRRNLFQSLKEYFKRFVSLVDRCRKKHRYQMFRQRYLQIASFNDFLHSKMFDAYIVGSDQVWNLNITGGVDGYYFLNFPISNGVRKISYAASSEIFSYGILRKNGDLISSLLAKFDKISVREDSLKNELQNFVSSEISVCVDPTLLLFKDDYQKIAIKPKEKEYVLVYHMVENLKSVECAEEISLKTGATIIEIHASFDNKKSTKRHKYDVGPLELLGYIMYSKYVITTSYHGILLSVILEKDFWTFETKSFLRQKDILQKLNLLDRVVDNIHETDLIKAVDYIKVRDLMNRHIKDSKHYLLNSLGL